MDRFVFLDRFVHAELGLWMGHAILSDDWYHLVGILQAEELPLRRLPIASRGDLEHGNFRVSLVDDLRVLSRPDRLAERMAIQWDEARLEYTFVTDVRDRCGKELAIFLAVMFPFTYVESRNTSVLVPIVARTGRDSSSIDSSLGMPTWTLRRRIR